MKSLSFNKPTPLVDEFSLNFAGMTTVANNNVLGNLADNGYYYATEDTEKTTKLYTARNDAYYGHYRANNSDNEFQLDNNTLKGVSVLNYDGNVLQLSPYGNSGYNLSASFGRYDDLNLVGQSRFEFLISKYGTDSKTLKVSLVQDKGATNDACTGEYVILSVDNSNNVYFDGGAKAVATFTRNDTTPSYLKVTYMLDNSGVTPRHKVTITNASTNQVITDTAYTALAQITDSNFDFTKDYFGIKFKAEDTGTYDHGNIIIKSLSFTKKGAVVNGGSETQNFVVIDAKYSNNMLMDVSLNTCTLTAGNGLIIPLPYSVGVDGATSVERFIWNSIGTLKPLNVERQTGNSVITIQ